ncbi:MAG: hypothetical protein ACREUG_02875, partial [Steroidobacteraceae bacterium]
MAEAHTGFEPMRLASPSGLRAEINANGSLRRLDCDGIMLSLYLGNELEGGPANLYLRRRASAPAATTVEWTPLLGPRSPTRFRLDSSGALVGAGEWRGIGYSIALVLARGSSAWLWHVRLDNATEEPQEVDLTYAQDLALAQYWAIRLNEYYVSQYLDHTPLDDAVHGRVIATRQNLAVDGRYPWCLIGSLRSAVSFATDALQFQGPAGRSGQAPAGMTGELPGRRLQHEHSLAVIRDAPIRIEPGRSVAAGFFGLFAADHPAATGASDLARLNEIRALPEAAPPIASGASATAARREPPSAGTQFGAATPSSAATLFSASAIAEPIDLDSQTLRAQFTPPWRHEERDEDGALLSFFHGEDRHVVLRRKELRVLRPHGQLLRTGGRLIPDETALTSTIWMRGVFHSMLTQGHVSINRLLSTVHGYVGLFRSHGQRVFVELGGSWQLLDVPSAFEMSADAARWLYRIGAHLIEIRSEARFDPHELTLSIDVRTGAPVRCLISNHLALEGDDGSGPGRPTWRREREGIAAAASPDTDIGRRFPEGRFLFAPLGDTRWEQVGGDELLFADGRTRGQPYLCFRTAPVRSAGLGIRGELIGAEPSTSPRSRARGASADEAEGLTSRRDESADRLARLELIPPAASELAEPVARLADMVPWLTHDALIHYLSPRGLEQYSGGGWGTRDVSQGPVELLLALGPEGTPLPGARDVDFAGEAQRLVEALAALAD